MFSAEAEPWIMEGFLHHYRGFFLLFGLFVFFNKKKEKENDVEMGVM